MATRARRLALAVTLAIFPAGGASSVLAQEAGASMSFEPATVRLQLTLHAPLDSANLDLARITAQTLLASAGIRMVWRACSDGGGCGPWPDGPAPITAHLISRGKPNDGEACGEVVIDAATHVPTILIYLSSVLETIRVLRFSRIGRSNPRISTLAAGHVLGVALAHEVGHFLGLHHASIGVMKARHEVDDALALRASRLVFTPQQGEAMRRALGARPPA